jgi:hypothetical protein
VTAGQRAGGLVSGIKEWAPATGGIIAAMYFFLQGITLLTGGMKTMNQFDLTSIGSRVTVLEEAQKTAAATQAATVDEIRNTKAAILDRLNSMPRLTDYSAQDTHLSRLDERIGKAEVTEGTLSARLDSLDGRVGTLEGRQPYRNPQGRPN